MTKEQIEFWLSKMVSLDLANNDNKQRIIDTLVNSIYVYDDKAVINFNCREESEVIPLKLSTCVSDLKGLGKPSWINPNTYGDEDLFVLYPGKPVFGLVVYL